ncbi:MAG TPA: carbon-nitrogen hydrolase family protein [Anaerolineae bacterium]|nr:carbon-nitrogen hydrolase family protein [Anaerolineae bacterium]
MGDEYPKVRAAVVQAAPAFLDREASAEKAVRFIEEAGEQGVDLLAFPEGFIPAHPVWYHFHPATGKESLQMATELFKNSVEVPGPTLDALCAAARRAKVNVVIGVCEKRPATTGTMYNTQLFISREGQLLGKHQKLMPTVGERLVHTGGHGDTLQVFQTDAGRVSGLICGENSNPLAIFALAAQGTQIHVASWPNHFSRNEHCMVDAITFATRSLSYKCSCFVLNACATISDAMRERLPYTEEDRAFLSNPENGGGSSIIGADSMILAGPMRGAEEGLLVADLDLEDCVRAKLVHDYSGHYNRPDVFTLIVNRSVPVYVETRQGIELSNEDLEQAPRQAANRATGVDAVGSKAAAATQSRPGLVGNRGQEA